MNSFSDFNIKVTPPSFVGDKINILKVLNRQIIVHDYKIEDSKKKPGEKYLTLQISIADKKHVIFTGAKKLMEVIQQVPSDKFPFTSTIIERDEQYYFS